MNTERAKDLQNQLVKEAVAMLELGGEKMDISLHEKAIRLTGKAWGIPAEETELLMEQIQKEKEVCRKLANGETAEHTIKDALTNWSGTEIFEAMEDLFETSLRLNEYAERETMFKMAADLRECQNFLDWIEKTPAEKAV